MNNALTALLLAVVSGTLVGFVVCDFIYRRWLTKSLGVN